MNVNENNSIAYTQEDNAQSENAQNISVYTSENSVSSQEIQTQNNLVYRDEDVSSTPVNLQKDLVQESTEMEFSQPDNMPRDSVSIQNTYAVNTPLLQLNDLCKRYPGMGNYMSVFHMNLTILRGRIIGLLGPNGCGKTTLIKMINGLLAPTSGTVLINGMEPCPATKKVISYLPERTYLDNGMKVSQMVEYFADFYEDFSTEKAYHMLGALGISSSARLKTLSKGTKEKVQLILVMSRQADLYILDEPIAGVDPAARDYILRTIITNYNPGSTIILSTHLISDIENILDDVIFMKNGSLMLYTSVDSIRSQMGKSVDTYFREVYAC